MESTVNLKVVVVILSVDSDVQEVFECWESDPYVAKYMFWTSHNDINKTLDWIKKELSKIDADHWYRWAILSK